MNGIDDAEWKHSVDNRLNILVENQGMFDTRLGRVEADVSEIKASMVTKAEFGELSKAMTHYAAHVEHMFRRVSELEKRIPPQQAA